MADYAANAGCEISGLKAALIDMDGVLYDTMKYHTLAWQQIMCEIGINCERDEFYLYEGMTGAATIRLLMEREMGHVPSEEEVRQLYAKKSERFHTLGKVEQMPGAGRMLSEFVRNGIECVLVTGSGQKSILDRISKDYPGCFGENHRVTSADVKHGKPNPEPYLKGLQLAGAEPYEAIVVENAPLGVRAGVAAGCFTVAVTTGPIPREAFEKENANLIFSSMEEFADNLPLLIRSFSLTD